jgi:hypothetical protein
VDSDEYPQIAPDNEGVLDATLNQESPDDPSALQGDYQWYEPGLFSRLAANKPLIILLVIAFLLLVIGPSLFYVFNPPRPKPPIPVRGQGFPA